jgi:hypothetical protein
VSALLASFDTGDLDLVASPERHGRRPMIAGEATDVEMFL